MANFGSFFGGLAQGINAGLPLLMQQRQQEQQAAFQQKKFDLEQQQLEAKNRTETQAKQLEGVTKGVDQLSKVAPDQVGPYVAGWVSRYEQQFNPLPMAFKSTLKKNPQDVLSVLNNGNPDEVRQALGSEQNFLELWPKIVANASEAKANQLEQQNITQTQPYVQGAAAQGISQIDARIQAAQALVQEMIDAGLPQARIEKAQGRVEELIKQRTTIATSPTALSIGAVGGDASGPLYGQTARAVQERELALKQQEAFQGAQAREAGQFAGSRLSVAEAQQIPGAPVFAPKPWYAPEGGGGVFPGAPGAPGGGVLPRNPQAQAIQMEQFKSIMKQAETDVTAANQARSGLTVTNQMLDTVKRLGPSVLGPGFPTISRVLSKNLASQGATAADLQSLDSMRTWKAVQHTKQVAPVSDSDFERIASASGGETLSYQANLNVLGAIKREEERTAALGSIGNAFIEGRMGKDVSYSQRKNMVLNQLEKRFAKEFPGYKPQRFGGGEEAAAPKQQGAAQAPAQQPGVRGTGEQLPFTGSVGRQGAATPVWKAFDPVVRSAIESYVTPDMQPIVSAVVHTESRGKAGVVHPAPKTGQAAEGVTGIKPQFMNDYGLPGIRRINNPKDPLQAVGWTSDVLNALLDKYQGNKTLALAAYNQGMGTVDQFVRETQKGGLGKVSPDLRRRYNEGLKYARDVLTTANRTAPINAVLPNPQQEQPLRVPEVEALRAGGRVAGTVLGMSPEETARAGGRMGAEAVGARVGQAVGTPFGPLGRFAGTILGMGAGSLLSSYTFDPTREPLVELGKTAGFGTVGEAAGALVRKVLAPARISPKGAVYVDVLTQAQVDKISKEKGISRAQAALDPSVQELLLPGSAAQSTLLQTAQEMGARSSFTGGRILQIREAGNKVLQGFGDDYAGKLLADKAIGLQKYRAFDAVAKTPVDLTIAGGISKSLRRTYGIRLEGTVLTNPAIRNSLDRIDELKAAQTSGRSVSFSEVQGVRQDLMTIWQDLNGKDPKAAADVVKLMKGLDTSMEVTARKAGSNAYKLYKEANEHWRIAGQGATIENMLTNARGSQLGHDPLGMIDPARLSSQLTDANLKKLPYKLDPEHVSFMRDLAVALEQNKGHEGWMRVMAMGAEYGGGAVLATGLLSGTLGPAGFVTQSFITLTPSMLAYISTNPTMKKFILEGIKVSPGTGEAWNIASKLGILMAKEHLTPPTRVDQNGQKYIEPQPQRTPR